MRFCGSLGGHQVNLTGTIEDIYAQAHELYPDFDIESQLILNAETYESSGSNSKRSEIKPELCNHIIGYPWNPGDVRELQLGMNKLLVKAECEVKGRTCTQVSCVGLSEIVLCSERDYDINVSCATIAGYANDIIKQCTIHPNGRILAGGQMFDTDGWNVVARQYPGKGEKWKC
jgi:hypothetical protein